MVCIKKVIGSRSRKGGFARNGVAGNDGIIAAPDDGVPWYWST